MSYKPKTLKSDFVRGTSGVAKVAISPDKKKAKIEFKDETNKAIVVSEFPSTLTPGTWFVTLDQSDKKVLSFRPANGIFTCKFQKFPAPEGEQPAPKVKQGADWNYQYFIALIEIIQGQAKGLVIPAMLRYHFGEAIEDDKSVVAFTHPKSKYTPQLVEFCDVTGAWNRGAMAYKDNILPMLEKRILREDKKFQVVMKNGYADSFLELDAPVEEELPADELEQETLPEDEG